MLSNLILINLAAAAVCACAAHIEPLNSERIEQRFGSYGIEVIEQSPVLRRSNLFSMHGDDRICRTYAIVSYEYAATASIAVPHQAVLDGGSIGETFESFGWEVHKETLYIGEINTIDLPSPVVHLMHIRSPGTMSVHAYRLILTDGQNTIQYATILEAHHPDYLGKDELLAIYTHGEKPLPAGESIAGLLDLLLTPAD